METVETRQQPHRNQPFPRKERRRNREKTFPFDPLGHRGCPTVRAGTSVHASSAHRSNRGLLRPRTWGAALGSSCTGCTDHVDSAPATTTRTRLAPLRLPKRVGNKKTSHLNVTRFSNFENLVTGGLFFYSYLLLPYSQFTDLPKILPLQTPPKIQIKLRLLFWTTPCPIA